MRNFILEQNVFYKTKNCYLNHLFFIGLITLVRLVKLLKSYFSKLTPRIQGYSLPDFVKRQ